jgi:hypothetical protein
MPFKRRSLVLRAQMEYKAVMPASVLRCCRTGVGAPMEWGVFSESPEDKLCVFALVLRMQRGATGVFRQLTTRAEEFRTVQSVLFAFVLTRA